MAQELVSAWFNKERLADESESCRPTWPRVLDPACGTGNLILAVINELCDHLKFPASGSTPTDCQSNQAEGDKDLRTAETMKLGDLLDLSQRIHGVDIDQSAVLDARRHIQRLFSERTKDTSHSKLGFENSPKHRHSELSINLARQIVVDDALSRFAMERLPEVSSLTREKNVDSVLQGSIEPLNAEGREQFDLIIANPPFVRERDSKSLFDAIRKTEFGRQWYRPRMDLWHYFFHLAVDLLCPGGILSFLVPAYWIRSSSGGVLAERILTEGNLESVTRFGDRTLFKGVQGKHVVFQFRKRDRGALHESARSQAIPTVVRDVLTDGSLESAWRTSKIWSCDTNEFLGIRRPMFRSPAVLNPTYPSGVLPTGVEQSATVPLGELFEVRQGIAENPPRISRSIAKRWNGRFTSGAAVFVLTTAERDQLALLPHEEALLRPYYNSAEIQVNRLPEEPRHWLLYLTRETAPEITALPTIARHLEPFQDLLAARREVHRGSMQWWHLHWPREERLFLEPRLLGIQMGEFPRFVYVERPAFVGFSSHVIVKRPETTHPSLAQLADLLNSPESATWFHTHAKKRGIHIDITGTILKQFPVCVRVDA